MEYHLAIKMNEIFPFTATRMDLESTMGHEMSDRERQTLYDITYVESLNNSKLVNKTRSRLTDIENKLMVTSVEGEGEEAGTILG